jgi:hypothetical protein
LHDPFTGALYMPDTVLPTGTTPVLLADGQTVAQVQWHMWTTRSKFEILDLHGNVLAQGGSEGFTASQYVVRTLSGSTLVQIKLGMWRPINGAVITLANGRTLSIRQVTVWSNRKFEFFAGKQRIGRILPTTRAISFHPDSYVFELTAPVMSTVEAVGLAHSLRSEVRSKRQASNT